MNNAHSNHRSLSALSAYHTGLIAPMKIRTEAPGNLRLYSGSPTRSEKEQVSISSFYYKERVSVWAIALGSYPSAFLFPVPCIPGTVANPFVVFHFRSLYKKGHCSVALGWLELL